MAFSYQLTAQQVDNCQHHLDIICTQFCIAAPVKIQNNMILRKICYHYTEFI